MTKILVIFKNVSKSGSLHYKLAVTMRRLETSVTILGFEMTDGDKWGQEPEQEQEQQHEGNKKRLQNQGMTQLTGQGRVFISSM